MKKKTSMVFLLFVFVILVGVLIIQIDQKSGEKINSQTSSTNTNTTETVQSATGKVRKSNVKPKPDMDNILEITDNFFIQQTNDIYINPSDYIDKTVKLEGFVYSYIDYNTGDTCYAVIRNTPGCCGNDGLAGLDIRYTGDYPELNTWVEVIGVIFKEGTGGDRIPAINVASITEKEVGTSFVTN